jgi:hypothetical protein
MATATKTETADITTITTTTAETGGRAVEGRGLVMHATGEHLSVGLKNCTCS